MINIDTLVEEEMRTEIFYPFIDNASDGMIYVELGVFVGGNISRVANRAKEKNKNIEIIGIDNWEFKNNGLSSQSMAGAGIEFGQDFKAVCRKNLDDNGLNNVKLITGDTNSVVEQFEDESIDCIFIDALHTVKWYHVNELNIWLPKVKLGGLITGHDWPVPGIQEAVKEVFSDKEIFVCSSNGGYRVIK